MENNVVCISRQKLEEIEDQLAFFKEEVDIQKGSIQNLSRRLVDAQLNCIKEVSFCDSQGNEHKVIYNDGDNSAGLPSGWGLEENSLLYNALENLEIYKKALGILARRHAVKTELSPHPSVANKIFEWAVEDARKGMRHG